MVATTVFFGACGGNPFAPKKHTPTGVVDRPAAQPTTSAEIAMDNLARAFNERDKELKLILVCLIGADLVRLEG